MSCKTYDPCLDGKLNQIGSYASVARQSAEASQASATQSAASASASATSAANSENSANDAADSASEANNYLTQVTSIFNEFEEKYLGSFAIAPTTDNEGNPLQVGALYWNSSSNALFVWDGISWVAAPSGFNELTTFLATGTPFARNLVTRGTDSVNIRDYGNTDWPNDSGPALQAAANAAVAQNRALNIPSGTYKIDSNVTLPEKLSVIYNGPKRIGFGAGTITDESGYIAFGTGKIDNIERNVVGLDVRNLKSTSRPPFGVGRTVHNYFYQRDQVDSRDQSTPWVSGLNNKCEFGGGNTAGARSGIISTLHQVGPIALDSQYDGHSSIVAELKVFAAEGTLASPRGAYFGINSYVALENPGLGAFNVTGGEINLNTKTGTSVYYRSGLQFASYGTVRASAFDAAIAISNVGSGVDNSVTWKHGILCGRMNGRHAFSNDSIAFAVDGGSVLHGIDFTSYSEPNPCNILGDLIRSAKFTVGHGSLTSGSASIQLGSKTMTSTPFFDFYTNNSGNQSARIIVSGTNPLSNQGDVSIQSEVVRTNLLTPGTNNLYSLGAAGLRWTEVFATNGTINTSDARNKQQVRTITDQEKSVATKLKSLIRAYKWNDAVEQKGENARIHFGVIAQEVKEAFESEGLNADEYGIFCYDEWDAVEDTKDENGEILIKGRSAGNSYGVRYNELTMFILANI